MESTLTSKGQITLPKLLRDHLKLEPHDRVKFFLDPNGHVVILPKLPASALRGMVRTSKRASLQDIDRAIATRATARSRRDSRT
jgi:AbrB family looped-hinge helix DNA binding protein